MRLVDCSVDILRGCPQLKIFCLQMSINCLLRTMLLLEMNQTNFVMQSRSCPLFWCWLSLRKVSNYAAVLGEVCLSE